MSTGRLEAFSDGVLAIIITIMVLGLTPPESSNLSALWSLWPVFFSYILSFVFVGIYWSNHHHMLQAAQRVTGAVLWANLHLLFWLSLVPFTTAWMGTRRFAEGPVAAYGAVLLMSAIAYAILATTLVKVEGKASPLAKALGHDAKGWFSIACYLTAFAAAFWKPTISCAIYVLVAVIWLVPDRRIEAELEASNGD